MEISETVHLFVITLQAIMFVCLCGWPVGMAIIAKKRGHSQALFVALGLFIGLVLGMPPLLVNTLSPAIPFSLSLVALGIVVRIAAFFVPTKD